MHVQRDEVRGGLLHQSFRINMMNCNPSQLAGSRVANLLHSINFASSHREPSLRLRRANRVRLGQQ